MSDMKLKLRLIGLEPSDYKWGVPFLAIEISLFSANNSIYTGTIGLSFLMLAKHIKGEVHSYAEVWTYDRLFRNLDEQDIRVAFKDMMDKFLSVYLEANPRKYIDETSGKK